MLSADQGKIVVDLVRRNSRILRGERFRVLRSLNALVWAQEAYVSEQFLLPFSSCLRRAIDWKFFDKSVLPPSVGSLFNKAHRCSVQNLSALDSFGNKIWKDYHEATQDTVLAGEGAALAGLYHDPGAFRAVNWEALLKNGTCANGDKPKELGPPAEEWSEKTQFGNGCWRKPKPALLITFLASHVGDPSASPTPPMWPHLGLALLVYKGLVRIDEVLEKGAKLNQREEVEHGLAIATHIFPELAKWTNSVKLGIPGWERKLAVPIAARRLMMGERE